MKQTSPNKIMLLSFLFLGKKNWKKKKTVQFYGFVHDLEIYWNVNCIPSGPVGTAGIERCMST